MPPTLTEKKVPHSWAHNEVNYDQGVDGLNEGLKRISDLLLHQWAFNRRDTVGLTAAFFGGMIDTGAAYSFVTGGSIALTDNATNYVERTAAGVVSSTTTGFTYGTKIPMWIAVTSGGAITAVTDQRLIGTGSGSGGAPASHNHTSAGSDGGVLTNDEHDGFSEFVEIADPATPAGAKVRVYPRDDRNASWLAVLDDTGLVGHMLRDTFIAVRNTTGATIAKGRAATATGADTGAPSIALADADLSAAMPALGLVVADIASPGWGRLQTSGFLGGLDTSGFTGGQLLYVSTAAGSLTATKPTHPALAQPIALVVTVHATTGVVLIIPGPVEGGDAGTRSNSWKVGDGAAGTKAVDFVNAAGTAILRSQHTAPRTLTLPDASGTLALTGGAGGSDFQYETRSANAALTQADKGKVIFATATFTQTATAAATLGAGWWCVLRNHTSDGTTILTFDPASSETVDGLATLTLYSGETRLVMCDGSAFFTLLLEGGFARFTTGGNFTVPPGIVRATIECIGAGGGGGGGRGGANNTLREGGSGGGGGARIRQDFGASILGAAGTAIAVTVGAAGAAGAAGNSSDGGAGGTGGNTSFGSFVTAGGGGAGAPGLSTATNRSGGGGGGNGEAGGAGQTTDTRGGANATAASAGYGGAGSGSSVSAGAPAEFGGACGGSVNAGGAARVGHSSQWGGAGGGAGGSATAAGTAHVAAAGGVSGGYSLTGGGGGTAGDNLGSAGGPGGTGNLHLCGGGGGGGGSNQTGGGGNGGVGGTPGSGGGGGGGGVTTGGAGGAGGVGECRVWYS